MGATRDRALDCPVSGRVFVTEVQAGRHTHLGTPRPYGNGPMTRMQWCCSTLAIDNERLKILCKWDDTDPVFFTYLELVFSSKRRRT